MVSVTSNHLERIRVIYRAFPKPYPLPNKDEWWKLSGDEIWIRIVAQVVVVGRANPRYALANDEHRSRISWKKLEALSTSAITKVVWAVLKDIGARYAGKKPENCRKTSAILRNYIFLRNFPGGPRGFVKHVAKDLRSSQEKIDFLIEHLSFIKHKGARDFLTTGVGLVTDRLAFDSRVLGALKHIGINVPDQVISNASAYATFEEIIIRKICKPLNILPAQLDQLLFYNYLEIKNNLKYKL